MDIGIMFFDEGKAKFITIYKFDTEQEAKNRLSELEKRNPGTHFILVNPFGNVSERVKVR